MSDDWTPVRKIAVWQTFSNTMLGLDEPTAAEIAHFDAQTTARAAVKAEYQADLAKITDTVARLLLDLHAENARGDCGGCDMAGYEPDEPEWPCTTTETIAKHFGVERGDF